MTIANSLLELKGQSPEQWLERVNRFLPPVVVAVLVVAIAYRLATLTWALVPGTPGEAPPPAAFGIDRSGAGPQGGRSYDVLLGSHLFGEAADRAAEPVVVQEVVDAPDTSLNLLLTGVNADPEAVDQGHAIISSGRGEQKMYRVGDAIDGGNGASLHSVYPDRVLLSRSGRLETLRLPKEDGSQPSAARSPRIAPPQPVADTSLREAISDNASLLTEAIQPMLERDGDQIVGFRLRPGRNREAFSALGLEDGDVLTDVNGMPMNDTQSAMRVFQALEEAQMANVTILRNGNPQVLVIDMNTIQSLVENRQ